MAMDRAEWVDRCESRCKRSLAASQAQEAFRRSLLASSGAYPMKPHGRCSSDIQSGNRTLISGRTTKESALFYCDPGNEPAFCSCSQRPARSRVSIQGLCRNLDGRQSFRSSCANTRRLRWVVNAGRVFHKNIFIYSERSGPRSAADLLEPAKRAFALQLGNVMQGLENL